MTLTRRTPLRRTTVLDRGAPLARGSRKPTPPLPRSWDAALTKVRSEGRCRVCGEHRVRLEAAHTVGREHDRLIDPEQPDMGRYVDPADVVPLCVTHHRAFDARELDLLPHLTLAEQAAAAAHVGLVAALRRLTGVRP